MTRLHLTLLLMGISLVLYPLKTVEAAALEGKGASGAVELADTYGAGKLYQYGSLTVMELHGSYREMGRQCGALRKGVLNDIYGQMIQNKALVSAARDLKMREQEIKGVYAAYPKYQEMMAGISETSGLGDHAYLACSYIQLYHILISEPPSPGGCSFNAAWGRYTSNATLIAGRNFDLSRVMNRYAEIMVLNPDDGSIPVAKIGYAGSVYLTSGFNREGLFLELNNGDVPYEELKAQKRESPVTKSADKTDTYLELFQLIQESANTAELDRNFASATTNIGCIVNVADEKGASSYEWIPAKYIRRASMDNESLVATNDFVDPSWGLKVSPPGSPSDKGQSILRMFNLVMMNYQYQGKITAQVMMQIMGTPTTDGGPFFPTYTSYQMVVVPEDLTIWFRVPGYCSWTEVDLENHFDPE